MGIKPTGRRRPKTTPTKWRLSPEELETLPVRLKPLPKTRGDCIDGQRPCPFVRCKWHLALDVSPIGSLTVNFPDLSPLDIPHTCALDIADSGAITLEQVGRFMNVTRERVRQIEANALSKARKRIDALGLSTTEVLGLLGQTRQGSALAQAGDGSPDKIGLCFGREHHWSKRSK